MKRDDRVCDVMCQSLAISFFFHSISVFFERIFFFCVKRRRKKIIFPQKNIDRRSNSILYTCDSYWISTSSYALCSDLFLSLSLSSCYFIHTLVVLCISKNHWRQILKFLFCCFSPFSQRAHICSFSHDEKLRHVSCLWIWSMKFLLSSELQIFLMNFIFRRGKKFKFLCYQFFFAFIDTSKASKFVINLQTTQLKLKSLPYI